MYTDVYVIFIANRLSIFCIIKKIIKETIKCFQKETEFKSKIPKISEYR